METVREVREDEAPRDATQGGISTGAGVDLRHFAQYIGPLVEASYVVERTGRVKGVLRRLKVYTLTAEGRRLASSIRDRVYAAVVRIRDAEEVREAKIVEIVSRRPDAPVLDIVREAIEEGCVDLNTDEGTSSGGI